MKSSFQVNVRWSAKLGISSSAADTLIIVDGTRLLAAKYCGEVLAFDLRTGHIAWNSREISHHDLVPDYGRGRLYVAATDQIVALSVSNGERLWSSTSDLFSHNGHPVQILANGDLLAFAREQVLVDAATGEVKKFPVALPKNTRLFVQNVAIVVQLGTIDALDVATGHRIWTTAIGSLVSDSRMRPFISNDLLIIPGGGNAEALWVLNCHTGQVLWSITGHTVVSNAVVTNGVVYVLDAQAKLSLLRAQDGSEIGSIQFEPPSRAELLHPELLYQPGAIGGSWLAVAGNIVAVYFQDTDVLSVMEISLPTPK